MTDAVDKLADQVQELKLDVTKLTPLSPEVIRNQATINIGMCLPHDRTLTSSRYHWPRRSR